MRKYFRLCLSQWKAKGWSNRPSFSHSSKPSQIKVCGANSFPRVIFFPTLDSLILRAPKNFHLRSTAVVSRTAEQVQIHMFRRKTSQKSKNIPTTTKTNPFYAIVKGHPAPPSHIPSSLAGDGMRRPQELYWLHVLHWFFYKNLQKFSKKKVVQYRDILIKSVLSLFTLKLQMKWPPFQKCRVPRLGEDLGIS